MKKSILPLLFVFMLSFLGNKIAAQGTGAKTNLITKNPDGSIRVLESAIVPKNHAYFVYDDAGIQLLFTYKGGVPVKIAKLGKKVTPKQPPKMDCVQINCPPTWGSNVTCWKCK